MKSTIQFYCIFGSYIGCSLLLMAIFITIYDLFDEIAEFCEDIKNDLNEFTNYANQACRTMVLRPRMTERAVFDAIVRLKRRRVELLNCKISYS